MKSIDYNVAMTFILNNNNNIIKIHDLASARGHEWLATCVPVQDVLSQGILSSSTTCDISGCSVEALHVITIWW